MQSNAEFDPYKILGVSNNATAAEISIAYRLSAKKHHPDAGGSADKFNALAEAYAILSDADRRAHFDSTGKISTPPNIDAMALDVIASIMAVCVEEKALHSRGKDNIVAAILGVIEIGQTEQRKNIDYCTRRIDVMAEAKRNIVVKDGNANVLSPMLDQMTLAIRKAKVEHEQNAAVLASARKIVEQYSWSIAHPVEGFIRSRHFVSGLG